MPITAADSSQPTEFDALLSALVAQRGGAKLCFDEEDGWFLQFCYNNLDDSWITLSRSEQRQATPSEAIRDASLAHNEECSRAVIHGSWTRFAPIALPSEGK